MSEVQLFEAFRKAAGTDMSGVAQELNAELKDAIMQLKQRDIHHHVMTQVCRYVEQESSDFRAFVTTVRDLLYDSKLKLPRTERERLFVLICKQATRAHGEYHQKKRA